MEDPVGHYVFSKETKADPPSSFLIEGIPSFVLAIVVFFCLPSRPETTKYLTEDQRTLACTRLNAVRRQEGPTGIDWKAVRYALLDWKTYTMAVMCEYLRITLHPGLSLLLATPWMPQN